MTLQVHDDNNTMIWSMMITTSCTIWRWEFNQVAPSIHQIFYALADRTQWWLQNLSPSIWCSQYYGIKQNIHHFLERQTNQLSYCVWKHKQHPCLYCAVLYWSSLIPLCGIRQWWVMSHNLCDFCHITDVSNLMGINLFVILNKHCSDVALDF